MNTKQNFGKAVDAVSPVVATLLLVLVAAGAAIGFGVFLNGFQKDTQENVSNDQPLETLRIGGSSTVYEFSQAAMPGFLAAHPTLGIDLQKGGSGAGKAAICKGLIDIGSSSSPVDATGKPGQDLATCPDFNGDGVKDIGMDLQITKVANDGVVFVTLPTNTHCAFTIQLTRAQAYSVYYHNADDCGSSTTFTAAPGANVDNSVPADGDFVDADPDGSGPILADVLNNLDLNADGDVSWGEIPMADPASGTQFCATGAAAVVEIFDRKDQGGTSEVFTQKVLGFSSPIAQLEDAGVSLGSANQGDGNQKVLDAVNAHADKNDALFFSSFGYASTKGLTIHQFGVTTPVAPSISNIKANTYDGSRPILYITAGAPSATEQLWLDWVTATANNVEFSDKADFISIYA